MRQSGGYNNDVSKRLVAQCKKLDAEMIAERARELRVVSMDIRCLMCGRVGSTVDVERSLLFSVQAIPHLPTNSRCPTCGGNLAVADL